jgi:hypothetical protein
MAPERTSPKFTEFNSSNSGQQETSTLVHTTPTKQQQQRDYKKLYVFSSGSIDTPFYYSRIPAPKAVWFEQPSPQPLSHDKCFEELVVESKLQG